MSLSLRPAQLPECRSNLIDFLQTPTGLHYLRRLDVPFARSELMGDDVRISTESLRTMQIDGLRAAVLFHASGAMTDLAVAAAPTLPNFDLADFDLPSPAGFIYFDKPIAMFTGDNDQLPTRIRACLWEQQIPGFVWMSFYGDWFDWLEDSVARGDFDRAALTECIGRDHPLYLENFFGVPLVVDGNMPPLSTPQGRLQEAEMTAASHVLRSAWLLLKQPLANVTEVAPDRSTRRRMQREGREPASVRVIELRRSERPVSDGHSEREYHHQWIVRGHWRQQWYAAHQVHRPLWIAPHVKGPEGAPMLGGEKVYAWKK